MLIYRNKKKFLLILIIFLTFSCTQERNDLYAENEPNITNNNEYDGVIDYFTDLGTLNISTIANGNYQRQNYSTFIKDINSPNVAYCHPDVEYFPEGFNGYKYWMVFTPYFGSVGTQQYSKRYENPTIVVSNDGLNWSNPQEIINPLQKTPSLDESFSEKSDEPKQGFWSDVDWMFVNGKFLLYYRGSFIKAKSLLNRGGNTNNNLSKLRYDAQRSIVRQTSLDGINWTPLESVYTSNPPFSPKNNHIISPSFVNNGKQYISYEVENNISPNFPGNDPSYVIRRESQNGLDFSIFKKSKIVNFINKPWTKIDSKYAPWHLQATYIDGFYFLCLAVGDVKKYTAESLYFAYSKDGINFKVLPKPMVEKNAYRSSVFPMKTDDENIDFGAVIAYKTGVFKYREFQLNKKKLDSCLAK